MNLRRRSNLLAETKRGEGVLLLQHFLHAASESRYTYASYISGHPQFTGLARRCSSHKGLPNAIMLAFGTSCNSGVFRSHILRLGWIFEAYVSLCWKYIRFKAFAIACCSKADIKFDILLRIMGRQKELWEINDVVLNNNYSSQDSEYGVHYSLVTGSADLPSDFYASER